MPRRRATTAGNPDMTPETADFVEHNGYKVCGKKKTHTTTRRGKTTTTTTGTSGTTPTSPTSTTGRTVMAATPKGARQERVRPAIHR